MTVNNSLVKFAMTVRDLNNIYPVLRKRFWKQSLTVFLKQGFLLLKSKMEIWEAIKGYENRYEVSNYGNVRTLLGKLYYKRNLKPRLNLGRRCVGLHDSKQHFRFITIARLVALAFIPNLKNKPQVNHIDGNKLNDCVDNLEWVTASENIIHAYRIGLKCGMRGEKFYNNKLSNIKVSEIKSAYNMGKITQSKLAMQFNVHQSLISLIVNNKRWGDVV